MSNNEIKAIIALFDSGAFLQIPKIALKAFKGLNALTLAILLDLERFSNQKQFFCKLSYLQDKLGISEPTAIKCLRFFENNGIITSTQHTDSTTKYYEINKIALAEFIINSGALNDDEPTQEYKSQAVETKPLIAEQQIKKQKASDLQNKSKDECVKYAEQVYENAKAKNETERGLPRVKKELWLEYIRNKYKLLAKKRKEFKFSLIDTHFNELRILQEFNIEPDERLTMCIENDYLGILFDNERERWRKQGKIFYKEVNFAEAYKKQEKNNDYDMWAGLEVLK